MGKKKSRFTKYKFCGNYFYAFKENKEVNNGYVCPANLGHVAGQLVFFFSFSVDSIYFHNLQKFLLFL